MYIFCTSFNISTHFLIVLFVITTKIHLVMFNTKRNQKHMKNVYGIRQLSEAFKILIHPKNQYSSMYISFTSASEYHDKCTPSRSCKTPHCYPTMKKKKVIFLLMILKSIRNRCLFLHFTIELKKKILPNLNFFM